ncbi:baculoviral IAP repeat-containing protein 1e-like [Anneissia japonica]|uniref:baculoviral IAP repeat-containing protein 1e-like n=1 Tax=Anneissia japonica TaxID=1529436 RepID=UPI0014258E42|nr:baculoviral IAP repeat-containing protein 1e-like [Anneissia japonica]
MRFLCKPYYDRMKEAMQCCGHFNRLLLDISSAISEKDEKYVDMLKVLYRDLVNCRSDLEKAKSAFDLFKVLKARGILEPEDISVLFETIEITEWRYLKEIIEKYETYPDKVEIARFSAHRQQIVALGKTFLLEDLQKACHLYKDEFDSNIWKLIQHLEYTSSVLTEDNIPSFMQRLRKKVLNEDFNQLLGEMSNAISKEDKKYVDMLRVLYSDTAEFKEELVRAKSAFDLFQILIVADILKPTDISVLFETIELTGLRFLKKIIEKYREYPDKVEITLFSAYRQRVVAWGKNVLCEVLQNVRQRYEIPVNISTNPWKVITYLENKDIISEDKWSSFLMNVKSSDNEEASTSKKQKLNEGNGEASTSKKLKLGEDSVIREYFLEEQKQSLKEKNYYCPPTYIDDTIDIDDLFTDLELVKREGRGKRVDAVSASLEEILNLISSKDSCKVLIEGEGGMGKTTLLRYISYRWANKKDNTFLREIVFLINIRDIKPNEDVINVISRIHVENFNRRKKMEITSAELGSFITNHDNEIVLLLDGLDELNSEATRPINLFENKNFSKVLLTSRPGNISDFANKCNVYVKVLGFNSNSIKQFIDNFFIRDPDSGKSLRKYLYKYEKDDDDDNYSQLYDLCRSPMLLLSICTIWKEKKCLPQNLASLFEELFCCILNQYNKKNHVKKLSNFAKIRQYKKYEKYEKCFSILGKCMYESLKENKFSIEFDDLSKYNSNEDENCFALAIGILYKELPKSAQDFSNVYTAP